MQSWEDKYNFLNLFCLAFCSLLPAVLNSKPNLTKSPQSAINWTTCDRRPELWTSCLRPGPRKRIDPIKLHLSWNAYGATTLKPTTQWKTPRIEPHAIRNGHEHRQDRGIACASREDHHDINTIEQLCHRIKPTIVQCVGPEVYSPRFLYYHELSWSNPFQFSTCPKLCISLFTCALDADGRRLVSIFPTS